PCDPRSGHSPISPEGDRSSLPYRRGEARRGGQGRRGAGIVSFPIGRGSVRRLAPPIRKSLGSEPTPHLPIGGFPPPDRKIQAERSSIRLRWEAAFLRERWPSPCLLRTTRGLSPGRAYPFPGRGSA